jgi:nucleoside-diphosphate-sugar epimerase
MTLKVLLTGATGIVGTELRRQLENRADVRLTCVSAHGGPTVHAWRLGVEPCPAELRFGSWDVTIHAAASTRWTQTQDEALLSNVTSTEALRSVLGNGGHLIYVSTAFVEDVHDHRAQRSGFRNWYEWSKAEGERAAKSLTPSVAVVRPSLIIGRSTDGEIARYNGFYSLLRAVVRGLAPVAIGRPDAPIDMVPVDIVAAAIVAAMDTCGTTTVCAGPAALRFDSVLAIAMETINGWCAAHELAPLESPRIVTRDQWDRFFRPFLNDEITPSQRKVIDLLSEFQPYMDRPAAFAHTTSVSDIATVLQTCVLRWCDVFADDIRRGQKPWRPTAAATAGRSGRRDPQ